MFGMRLMVGGRQGEDNLDKPISNFDVAGIPTHQWSSGLFECYRNIVPSCLLSFFCPCIMISQVIVRSQIPFLIAIKNAFQCMRRVSGYGFFIDLSLWSIIISAGLILALIFASSSMPRIVMILLVIILVVILGSLIFLMSHVRTAFRMKYLLPSYLPEGCAYWDMMLDCFITALCFPCSISQMARHVFQYDRWNPPIGMFLGDPYGLPPLEATIDRPDRADEAGLQWIDAKTLPGVVRHTGAYDRQVMLEQQQQQQQRRGEQPMPSAVPIDVVYAQPAHPTNPPHKPHNSK